MCGDKGANMMSWFESTVVAFREKNLQKAGLGGRKDDEITLRCMEFKTPGLQRGVGPFRCEARLERDRGWKGGQGGARREGDSAPSPGLLSVGKEMGLD